MNAKIIPHVRMTARDKVIEGASWLALAFLIGVAIYYWFRLPDTIPTHFGPDGSPDGYGGKFMFLLLPFLGLVAFAVMSVVVHYPQYFNFPTKVTEGNALRLYQIALRLVSLLKLTICLVFAGISWMTGTTAVGQTQGLSPWFLPVAIGLVVVPIVVSILQMLRLPK